MLNYLPLKGKSYNSLIAEALSNANHSLGVLEGLVKSVPNEKMLIHTLPLQESQHSTAIENIHTTLNELYLSNIQNEAELTLATKEAKYYNKALLYGCWQIKAGRKIDVDLIKEIQQILILDKNKQGYRVREGTQIQDGSGRTIYVPPAVSEVNGYMTNLIEYISEDTNTPYLDPLIKMAIIHYQFESIHPFPDGNGRTGRILNILYLIKEKVLSEPLLFLSRYINKTRQDYYNLLQSTRERDNWEEWIMYMVMGVAVTAVNTSSLIHKIDALYHSFKLIIKEKGPRLYNHTLINYLFAYPYITTQSAANYFEIKEATARARFEKLTKFGLLTKIKNGRSNYYFNEQLCELLRKAGDKSSNALS